MALPPGPRTPDFIQAIQFRARPLAYLDACAQRYGDIFTAGGNGASPSVYVSSPSVIQEMLAADNALFEPFREDWAARFLFGEDSMVFREGEGHQRERRLLTPPFHGERLRANADTIAGITRDVVDSWQAGEPFFVGPAMGKIWNRLKTVAEANSCVPHMLQVLDAARKAGLRVFYAMHHRYRPADYETWKYIAPIQKAAWSSKAFEYGTWGGEIRSEFAPQPGEIVAMEHWCSSGFANTDLDLQLKKHGIHQLIAIGLIAHTCVEATVRYAVELGYEVTVVKDATSDYSDEEMHAALDVNIPNYASAIVTTDQIVDSISSL